MDKDLVFDIRDYEYFKNYNTFSGSAGDYQYRIVPDGEILTVSIWKGKKCFQFSEIIEQHEFPLSVDGVENTIAWVKQKYSELK